MGTLLQHLTTGNLVRFIVSIPTLGQGALHLVEDVATGFVRAYQTLEDFKLAPAGTQLPADAPASSIGVQPSESQTAPVEPDTSILNLPAQAHPDVPATVTGPQAAPQSPSTPGGLPPLGG